MQEVSVKQGARDGEPAPALHLQKVCLAFDGEKLFDNLDLSFPAGLTSCLLGPSGVGKTSLLRLVAGLSNDIDAIATSGIVTDGEGRPLANRYAYMAQQDLLLPWCSVLDNVTLGPRLRGEPNMDKARQRGLALLEQVKLADRAQDRPATLSVGMRQRVALARTLLEDRPVVLMDEPFSALDAITRFKLQDLAAKLLRGRTVLLITHDPLEALRLGHRILVLSDRPVRLDTALEVADDPPRDPTDRALLAQQAELFKRLARAGGQA